VIVSNFEDLDDYTFHIIANLFNTLDDIAHSYDEFTIEEEILTLELIDE